MLLLLLLCCSFAIEGSNYNYYKGPLPRKFRKGTQYPAHGEDLECRPAKLHIARGTKRFRDLVVYSNSYKNLHFANSDSKIMSSRLHNRLSALASNYYWQYGVKLLVLKAWTPYPDYSLDNTSLHYEGNTHLLCCFLCVHIILILCIYYTGRSIRIHVTSKNVTRLLKMAILSCGFDWVMYDKKGYARLSVIPDGKPRLIIANFSDSLYF